MKHTLSILLLSLLLLSCAASAFADQPLHADALSVCHELLTGSWQVIEGGTRLNKLPYTFTYGEDEDDFFLFIAADGKAYLVWRNPDSGMILANQFAEVAFSADGQYLLLFVEGSASVYVRQTP